MKTLPAIFRLFRRAPPKLVEPPWADVLASSDEQQSASSYWREVTAAIGARGTLKPVNTHAVLRLVVAYVVADRTSAQFLRGGGAAELVWRTYADASRLATEIERDLGLPPA